jgi:PhzF family phenazine biosynthesis protein
VDGLRKCDRRYGEKGESAHAAFRQGEAGMIGDDLPARKRCRFPLAMRTPIFQLDAFATRRFEGNPAAVMPMAAFPPDATMLALAGENNLSETAFLVRDGTDYRIRWFTPRVEVPLCGHATLASAAVVMERIEPARREVVFHSASGPLRVTRASDGYSMDFPARVPAPSNLPPAALAQALGVVPLEVFEHPANYLALLASPNDVRGLAPDFAAIARLDRPGLVVTAAGEGGFDFTSRYFAPSKGVDEDPVTGGAHCMLAPFWAPRLGKDDFVARQASARGGTVRCALMGDRVRLEGGCVFYLEGEVEF